MLEITVGFYTDKLLHSILKRTFKIAPRHAHFPRLLTNRVSRDSACLKTMHVSRDSTALLITATGVM